MPFFVSKYFECWKNSLTCTWRYRHCKNTYSETKEIWKLHPMFVLIHNNTKIIGRSSFLVRAIESSGAILYFENSSRVWFRFDTLPARMNTSKSLFFPTTFYRINESLPILIDELKTSLSLLSDSSISTITDAFSVTFTRSFCLRAIFRENSSAFDRRLR